MNQMRSNWQDTAAVLAAAAIALFALGWVAFHRPTHVEEPANIPYAHTRIWDSPPVLQLFEEVLSNAPRSPFLCAAADSDDYIDYNADVDVRFSSDIPCSVTDWMARMFRRDCMKDAARSSQRRLQHNGKRYSSLHVTFGWPGGTAPRAVLIKSESSGSRS
jgi:hypothetical protein